MMDSASTPYKQHEGYGMGKALRMLNDGGQLVLILGLGRRHLRIS